MSCLINRIKGILCTMKGLHRCPGVGIKLQDVKTRARCGSVGVYVGLFLSQDVTKLGCEEKNPDNNEVNNTGYCPVHRVRKSIVIRSQVEEMFAVIGKRG